MSEIFRLITISVSHYCEKVRWALDWLEIPYVEESHSPPFHLIYTRRQGGKTVPVLVTQQNSFIDSTDILHYLDTIASPEQKLYPQEPSLRQKVEQWEELFNQRLGVATRCWGYYYALQQPELIKKMWSINAPWLEKIGLILLEPLMLPILQRGYNITVEGAEKSLEEIKQIFELVSEHLSSSGKYLVGESFSAADLTFAALASPVLRPENHPVYSSDIQQFHPDKIEIIKQLRETQAGKFALDLYQFRRVG